jgi:hypothetical protein
MFPDGEVYLSKLHYGQAESDSVRRLQTRLLEVQPDSKHSVTGTYGSLTDASVRAWQKSIGDSPDEALKSSIGPKQAAILFKGSGNTVINDLGGGTTLGRYLKTKGFIVDDTNVPYGRTSTWTKVKYIIVHHTVSSEKVTAEKEVANYVKSKGSYPPLSQIMLGQSGKVWICSKQRPGQNEPGRANHAGFGSWPGVPRNQMNICSLGIEVQCNGMHPLNTHATQYKTLIKLIAQLCKRYGFDETHVIGHKEWSSTGKVDPRDSMSKIRADVKAQLAKL